jgi:hypothetical protein
VNVEFLRDVVLEDVLAWVFVASGERPQSADTVINCVKLHMKDAGRVIGISGAEESGWRKVDGDIQGDFPLRSIIILRYSNLLDYCFTLRPFSCYSIFYIATLICSMTRQNANILCHRH